MRHTAINSSARYHYNGTRSISIVTICLILILVITQFSSFAQLPLDANGWTVFTPSGDSRIVYVSSSTGNDANTGLSATVPLKTIAAGYALLRDSFPDWLMLKSGDTWNEFFPNWEKQGRSATEPVVIKSYGTGPRPRIFTSQGKGFFTNRSNIAITDMEFFANAYDGTNGTDGPVAITMFNAKNNCIENCKIRGYLNGINVMWVGSGGPPTNIKLRRNVVVDSYRALLDMHTGGTYLAGIDSLLLEENLFDHNGWREDIPGADPTVFRRNIYIQSDCKHVITRGNISARSAAEGMQQRPGGVCENNLFLKNTTGFTFGKTGYIRNNVQLDSKDLDSINPRGGGFLVDYANGVLAEQNICTQRSTPATYNIGGIGIYNNSKNITLRKNIVYNVWGPGAGEATCFGTDGSCDSIFLTDNDFQMPNGEFMVRMGSHPNTLQFKNNRYFSSNAAPFWTALYLRTLSQYRIEMKDSTSRFMQVPYIDPNRTIGTYMTTLGLPASLDSFLMEARKQSRDYWRPEFMAASVNCYIRDGYRTPIAFTNSSDTTINLGNSVTLRFSNINRTNYSLSWDGGLTFTHDTTFTITPTSSGAYSVIIADSNELWLSCSPLTLHTFSVTIINPIVVTLSAFTPVCSNTPAFTLTGGSPGGGIYSGTGVSGGMFDPSITGAGTYTVSYNFSSGVANKTIVVNPSPVVSLAPFSAVCIDAPVFQLTGGSPGLGSFTGSGVSGTYFSPALAGAGTYTISYGYTDNNGCSSHAYQPIKVNALPTVTMLSFASDTMCITDGLLPLSSGLPAGGTYSGSGVSGNSFDPSSAGLGTSLISYLYTDSNGCSATANEFIIVDACTGIDDISNENLLNIFPNPSSGIVYIEYLNADQPSLKLCNAIGEIIYEETSFSHKTSIDLHALNLSKGVYYLTISEKGNAAQVKKLILQ